MAGVFVTITLCQSVISDLEYKPVDQLLLQPMEQQLVDFFFKRGGGNLALVEKKLGKNQFFLHCGLQ